MRYDSVTAEIERLTSELQYHAQSSCRTSLTEEAACMLETLELPLQDPAMVAVCGDPFILTQYLIALVESCQSIDFRKRYLPTLYRLEPEISGNGQWIRVRRFAPEEGLYCGSPYQVGDCAYAILNGEPVLITPLTDAWRDEVRYEAHSGLLTRPEVRFISSLLFSGLHWHGPPFYFLFRPKPVDLPLSIVSAGLPLDGEAYLRLQATLMILDRVRLFALGQGRLARAHYGFRYAPDTLCQQRASQLFSAFRLDDDLTLRTALLLVKCTLLWAQGDGLFGEEAATSLFYGIEGCLRMIGRRLSRSGNVPFKKVSEHILATFPNEPGYVDMLIELRGKRNQTAHPEPREDASWLPDIWADDYYEGWAMASHLFYYGATGIVLADGDGDS